MIKVLAIIPSLNEEVNIAAVVTEALKHTSNVLVVDDGSTDNTSQVAKVNGAVIIRHRSKRGQGAALRSGFSYAIRKDVDVVITLDADGQHDPSHIPEFIEPIAQREADFVIGSRFVNGNYSISLKTAAIKLFSLLTHLLTGLEITDVTCGYRAIRVSSLTKLKLSQAQYSAPELIIEAWKRKLKITEIPIYVERRKFGLSKKRLTAYSFGLLFSILKTRLAS